MSTVQIPAGKSQAKPDEQEEEGLSRREFFRLALAAGAGGAAGAVAGAGATTFVLPGKPSVTGGPAANQPASQAAEAGQIKEVIKEVKVATSGVLEPWQEPEETLLNEHIGPPAAFDVKNGKIIRGRPVHWDEKYPNLKPLTFTARGKTFTAPTKSTPSAFQMLYRKVADSPCKIMYPLKRVDWEPGGDPAKINPQNRGKSKFVRISWDEAAKIIASEVTRVADKYGIEAVAVHRAAHGEAHTVVGEKRTHVTFMEYWGLSKYGALPSNFIATWASYAGWMLGAIHTYGFPANGCETGDLLRDIADNTEQILVWGGDTESKGWASNGVYQGRMIRFLKDIGIKFVHIEPVLTKGGGIFADKWIPVFPGTDPALRLAVAYIWLTEGTYDKEYLKTHAVGYEKWFDYVLGKEDGIPKTPKWASPLCGVPVWTIKALARQYASKVTSTMHGGYGGGISRAPYSHETTRMEIYLLAMQGWGKPGVHSQFSVIDMPVGARKKPSFGSVAPDQEITASMNAEFGKEKVAAAYKNQQWLPWTLLHKCILEPPLDWWTRENQDIKLTYPNPGKSEIHLLWHAGASWFGIYGNNERFKALKSPKIETYICMTQQLEEAPYYADLILPICTTLEADDIRTTGDAFTELYISGKVVEPRGEAKTDWGVCLAVAEKLGFKEKLLKGYKTEQEWYEGQIKKAFDISGWKDLLSYDDFRKNKYVVQETPADWESRQITPANNFYKDPKQAPLATPTGLIEFESQFLLKNFPDDKERPPVARYIRGGPKSEGWTYDEDRLISKKASKYPLVMASGCPYWARHSMHGDVPWTREISKTVCWDGYNYENLWIHPTDAQARGIKQGDIVRFFNDRGGVLGAAFITELVMPGVIYMVKARQCDFIIPDELNRAGTPNSINTQEGLSYHANVSGGQWAYLVQLEKVTFQQMGEWREKYPQAFARDYDPDYGPLFSGWVEKEA